MTHDKFGWSYPPGCDGPPDQEVHDPHPLVEKVRALLEAAGVQGAVIDEVDRDIEKPAQAADRSDLIRNAEVVLSAVADALPAYVEWATTLHLRVGCCISGDASAAIMRLEGVAKQVAEWKAAYGEL